jgi:hypothetical protein
LDLHSDEDTLEITTRTDQIGIYRDQEENRKILVRTLTKVFTSHLGSSDVGDWKANQRSNKPHEKHRTNDEVEELDEDVENYHDR